MEVTSRLSETEIYGQIAAIGLFHYRAECLLCGRVSVILSFTFVFLSYVLLYSFSLV